MEKKTGVPRRLEVPKSVKLPMKGRKLEPYDYELIANRYLLGDTYRAIRKELGCQMADIAATIRLHKLRPRNPKLMGSPRGSGKAHPHEQTRINQALAQTETLRPLLPPAASVQRLVAEFLGQLQGLVHGEVSRVEIAKEPGGSLAFTYDRIERHTQKWP
jgi:hypothetical protein